MGATMTRQREQRSAEQQRLPQQLPVGELPNSSDLRMSACLHRCARQTRSSFGTLERALQQGSGFVFNIAQMLRRILRRPVAAEWYRGLPTRRHWANRTEFVYGMGYGVRRTCRSHRWLNLACAHYATEKERSLAARARDLVAALMTPSQIGEAQRLAREWNSQSRE